MDSKIEEDIIVKGVDVEIKEFKPPLNTPATILQPGSNEMSFNSSQVLQQNYRLQKSQNFDMPMIIT